MSEGTIAAIATAQGAGGIGVIRISGEDAFNIGDRIFKSTSGKSLSELKGYHASYGHILDKDNNIIDDAVALVFKAPHSYTGENVLEISCHGGIFITKEVLRLTILNGAKIAEPGEFTKRAFLNGKMDLTEAEAVMNLISAQNKASASAAVMSINGALSDKIKQIKNALIDCAAHLSVWADYPEDDISPITQAEISDTLNDSIKSLEKLIIQCDKGRILRDGINTAIVGRPNVGKSTIMNLLSCCERSIVTDIAGTTRDIIEETVRIGDFILRISDTAGIRDTDNPIELAGIVKARERLNYSDFVIAVFDASEALTDSDSELISAACEKPCVAIINKSDLDKKIDESYINSKFKYVINTCAKDNIGFEGFEKILEQIFKTSDFDPSAGVLAGERQRNAASKALDSLTEAREALNSGMTLDAVTVSIEYALDSLMELTGESTNEEIVNNIFSRFCVGK